MIPVTDQGRRDAEAQRVAALKAGSAYSDSTEGPGEPVAPGEIGAEDFQRPIITAGHQAPSPGHDEPRHVDFTGSRARGMLIPRDVQASMGPAGGDR